MVRYFRLHQFENRIYMAQIITEIAIHNNARRKARILLPYTKNNAAVLDFGCGDLALARELKKVRPNLRITGVDIVDFGIRPKGILFSQYDGEKLPFQNNSFDVVIAWHVFHHIVNPLAAFCECMRVAKQRVIFVEPVWRHQLEVPGMMFMDWLFNVWKSRDISMAFTFHSRAWWEEQIIKHNGRLRTVQDVEILPPIFPTGRSLLFVVDKA